MSIMRSNYVLTGCTQSSVMSHESSLNILSIMDQARRQMGLVYDADN